MDINEILKKNSIWLIVLAFFLISIAPWFFIPLIIIILIFYKPILLLINKYKPMEGSTIDYSKLTNKTIKFSKNLILTVVIAVIVLVILINMIVIIPAGQTGVYHLFGKVKDKEIQSGIHLINPLANIEKLLFII